MGAAITTRKILVVRNDKLGDFTLALPSFDLLKRNLPDAQVVALVPEYTVPVAKLSRAIDDLIVDPGAEKPGGSAMALASRLRQETFDAAIALFSTTRVAVALLLAGVPLRYAPATKLAQVFYSRRITQRRSKSIKPEFEYNLDLVRAYLQEHHQLVHDEFERPVIRLGSERVSRARQELTEELGLPNELPWVFLHPHSGGSAGNLSIQQYAELGRGLMEKKEIGIVVTAGPGELAAARDLASELDGPHSAVYESRHGLQRFTEVLATADLFISGSTGPLHLAGALDRPTAAFYPRRATSSPLRWQTLNRADNLLAFVPPPTADERDVASIDVQAAAARICERFLA